MATRPSTVEFLLDQLGELEGIRAQKMFGEYALYYDEKVVGLVCDDQLFIKITAAGRALAGESYAEGRAYPGAKPSMLVDAERLEDDEKLCELVRATANALPPPKPKKKPAKKKPAKKKPVA
jgi:TfoX/Sxy family transcriptional regulator of competence genes